MSEDKTLRLTIEGTHCGACVNRVATALGKVGGAELLYDPHAATPEQITAAVNRIGYAARVAGE